MLKKDLRKVFLEKRNSLSYEDSQELSKKISQTFFTYFDPLKITSIHIFLPIHCKVEIDTSFIIEKIWESYPHIKTLVPKLNPEKTALETHVFNPSTALEENSWGIPEPIEASLFPEKEIDLVILPLLAFDLQGNRVGYGKGFYDRFLLRCRRDVLKTGLSFFEAVEKITDASLMDIPLTHCVTSEKVYAFGNFLQI